MDQEVTIMYCEQEVIVSKEVAEFLLEDKRRQWAQERSDSRHWSYAAFDPDTRVYSKQKMDIDHIPNLVVAREERQELRNVICALPKDDRLLVGYRYYRRMTQQQIGDILGISKMAVCKRLKKLHRELREILSASIFLCLLVYKSPPTVLMYEEPFRRRHKMKHKPIHIPPFIRTIGKKIYVVDSWFDPEARCDLTDKMKRLIDQDIRTLQTPAQELTSDHDPDRFG